jgi:hypothetical protein
MPLFITKIEYEANSIVQAAEIATKAKLDKKFVIHSVEEIVPPLQPAEYTSQKACDG